MNKPMSPWDEQAQFVVSGRDLILDSQRRLMVREIAFALEWAYEQGHAHGRLHEIDRARATNEEKPVLELKTETEGEPSP